MCKNISEIVNNFFVNVPTYNPAGITYQGWFYEPEVVETFVEPDISLKEGSLANSKIWLFTAPGAVGKSTYAKKLANAAHAIYLDLSIAHRIGGFYLTGGLQRNGLQAYMAQMAIVIDSLDEAFLGTGDQTRINFFDDIRQIALSNQFPLILFGRPEAITMSELILRLQEYEPAIIQLKHFSRPQALELVYNTAEAKLTKAAATPGGVGPDDLTLEKLRNHKEAARRFVDKILDSLDEIAKDPEYHFTGYAPVLDAVAAYLIRQKNFSKTVLAEKFTTALGLEGICEYILQRERDKVMQKLAGIPASALPHIYDKKVQMEALCSLYLGKSPSELVFSCEGLTPAQQQTYQHIAREFIEQHPFLMDGKQPTNAVFAGVIQSFILKRLPITGNDYGNWQASTLLAQFYFNDDDMYTSRQAGRENTSPTPPVKSAHIPYLVESYVALSNQGQYVEVEILKDDGLEVEITLIDEENKKARPLKKFTSSYEGKLVFRQQGVSWYIDDLAKKSDTVPEEDSADEEPRKLLDVEFSTEGVFILRTPLYVNVNNLKFDCSEIKIIGDETATFDTVVCETNAKNILGNMGKIYIYCVGQLPYPFTNVENIKKNNPTQSQNVKKAFLSFCKIIRIFRTHKFGSLAKDEAKIDSPRVKKNYGEAITRELIAQKILRHEALSHKYFLDAKELGKVVDMSYLKVQQRQMSDKLLALLQKIVIED